MLGTGAWIPGCTWRSSQSPLTPTQAHTHMQRVKIKEIFKYFLLWFFQWSSDNPSTLFKSPCICIFSCNSFLILFHLKSIRCKKQYFITVKTYVTAKIWGITRVLRAAEHVMLSSVPGRKSLQMSFKPTLSMVQFNTEISLLESFWFG